MSVDCVRVQAPDGRKSRKKLGLMQQKVAPYVFILPFVISFLAFFLYPIVSTIIMSFQEILGPENLASALSPVLNQLLLTS